MKLKEYNNKLSNNKEHPHFYSTPNYMGFADALYLSKYGEVGKGGVLKLNKTQNHYNKTMEKWTGYLNEGDFRSLDDVVHNTSGVKKALHTSFNIVPRTKNTTGGSRGGGNDGRRDNMNLNKPTLLMYGAGENKFKPMLFAGGSQAFARVAQRVVESPTSGRQEKSGQQLKITSRQSKTGPNGMSVEVSSKSPTNKWSEAVQEMTKQQPGNPFRNNASKLAASALLSSTNHPVNKKEEKDAKSDEPYTPFTQHNGFDGLKFDKDGKLLVDMNRNKPMDESSLESFNDEQQKAKLLKLSNWKVWPSDASTEEHVRMMFHYCNINPNPTVILPNAGMFADYIAHEMKTLLEVKNSAVDKEKIKNAIIEVTNELNNAKCNLICETTGGGRRYNNKKSANTSYKYKNNTASYKYKYNNKKGGASSHQLEEPTPDTHTVIGYSNHNSYFKYNAHFGPMEDSVRQAVLSKFDENDKKQLLKKNENDACIKHTIEFRFMYIISAVLNYIGTPRDNAQIGWIRGGMFMAAYTWTIEFENALNKTIIDNSNACKHLPPDKQVVVTSEQNPFIKCMFQLTHLAEDQYNFTTNAPEELQDRHKFINSFNAWSQSAIGENKADPSRFAANILVPDENNTQIGDKENQWKTYIEKTKIKMILCHGGETFWLNRRLKKSGLMKAIQDNKNVIWSGSSAGIINCGVTTGLAASKRYSAITNPTRHSTVAPGDDPLPILDKSGNDVSMPVVLPTDTNTRQLTITKPPYEDCDFTGAGVYPGIVFPHCTSKLQNDHYLYPLMDEQLPYAIGSIPENGVNGKQIKHVEILSDMHMFLYHKGKSVTYPPVDYDVGTLNTQKNKQLSSTINNGVVLMDS